eukprot:7682051-Pyramimonas_sp.AAC.3
MQVFFKAALDAGNVLDTLLIQSIGCNLLLFAAALFALQDAANRDRLAASTFRFLNLTLTVKGACLGMVCEEVLCLRDKSGCVAHPDGVEGVDEMGIVGSRVWEGM